LHSHFYASTLRARDCNELGGGFCIAGYASCAMNVNLSSSGRSLSTQKLVIYRGSLCNSDHLNLNAYKPLSKDHDEKKYFLPANGVQYSLF
jgi:hypothetical protein